MNKFFKAHPILTNALIFLLTFGTYFGYSIYKRDYSLNTKFYKTTEIRFSPEIYRIKEVSDTSFDLANYLKKNKSGFRVILNLDGSCSTCIETLGNWRDFFQQHDISYNKLMIVGYDNTLPQLSYVKSQVPEIKSPFFFDPYRKFAILNNISSDGNDRYLLVDKNFKVVTAGSPFKEKSLLNTYLHYLSL